MMASGCDVLFCDLAGTQPWWPIFQEADICPQPQCSREVWHGDLHEVASWENICSVAYLTSQEPRTGYGWACKSEQLSRNISDTLMSKCCTTYYLRLGVGMTPRVSQLLCNRQTTVARQIWVCLAAVQIPCCATKYLCVDETLQLRVSFQALRTG